MCLVLCYSVAKQHTAPWKPTGGSSPSSGLPFSLVFLCQAKASDSRAPEDFGLFRFASIFNECAMVHSATRSCSDLFTTIKSMNIMLCVCSSAVVLLCSSIEARHSCYTTKYVLQASSSCKYHACACYYVVKGIPYIVFHSPKQ